MISKFENIVTAVTSEKEFSPLWRKLIALIALLISASCTFVTFSRPGWLWGEIEFRATPGIIETIIAIVLVSPLYFRGILKWSISIYGLISITLIIHVFASFIRIAEGGTSASPWIQGLILTSFLLSWFGIRPLPGLAWILVFAASVYNLINTNISMGYFGSIYILSGFIGLLLNSGLNPGILFKEIKEEFSNSWIQPSEIKTEIKETGKSIKNLTKK